MYVQVGADGMNLNSHFSIFQLSVILTVKGLVQWMRVTAIVYQYIHMLKEEGIQKWVFDELQQLGQIEFGGYSCVLVYLGH